MKTLLIAFLVFMSGMVKSQPEIKYPDTELPKDSALLFAPELINTGLFTRDFSMTSDGKEIYFSVMAGRSAVIMVSKYENEKWQEPEIASFSGTEKFLDFEPHVSPDGKRLYFLTTRPTDGEEVKPGWQNQNIFFVERTADGWSKPTDIGAPVNTDNNEFYPSLTNDYNIYFNHGTNANDGAIYCSKFEDGKYSKPQKQSFQNDSTLLPYNATISRDEHFILCCGNEKGVRKPAKYYIAFKMGDNKWSDLYDLTEYLGIVGGRASSISLSPDGKYIFYSGIVADNEIMKVYPGMKISKIIDNAMKPQSGSSNIYWISSDFIQTIRSEKLH